MIVALLSLIVLLLIVGVAIDATSVALYAIEAKRIKAERAELTRQLGGSAGRQCCRTSGKPEVPANSRNPASGAQKCSKVAA
jgi:hypothetical protein